MPWGRYFSLPFTLVTRNYNRLFVEKSQLEKGKKNKTVQIAQKTERHIV